MPIEIRELIIRARIEEDTGRQESSSSGNGIIQHDLVEECVEQVLKIIERKNER